MYASGKRRASTAVLLPGPQPISTMRFGASTGMRVARSIAGWVSSSAYFRYCFAFHCAAVLEAAQDDDTESIMTGARYDRVAALLKGVLSKTARPSLSVSDRIDKVLTNRWLALLIFFLIMWGVYYISIQTVGDWTIGWVEELIGWISGGVETLLVDWNASDWAMSLVIDGVIGGVGAVLVFVPQLMILYFFISILEDCGYMARVAFIMDRIFRRFWLSGKSFIRC